MISHVTVNVIVNRFLLGNKSEVIRVSRVSSHVLCCACAWDSWGHISSLTWRLETLEPEMQSPASCGHREKPDTEKWEEEVWLFVLVVTREHLIINSQLLWPLLVESLMWSLSSLGQPRPAQTLWLLPSCINNVVIILMGGHTNLHAFHYH